MIYSPYAAFSRILDIASISSARIGAVNQVLDATKLSVSYTFSRVSGFKSLQPVFFWCSLQSKETQKVHQHFRPFSRPENKKSGFRTADRPSESPKLPDFARFLPKMQEKTPFAVVDKRGFFFGWGGRIRTYACSSQSAVSYRLTTPQYFLFCSPLFTDRVYSAIEKPRHANCASRFSTGVEDGTRTHGLQCHKLAL